MKARQLYRYQASARTPAEKEAPVETVSNRARNLGLLLLFVIVVAWLTSYPLGFDFGLTLLTLLGFGLAIVGLRYPVVGILGVGMLSALDAVTRNMLLTGGLLRFNSFNYWLLIVILLSVFFLLRLTNIQIRLLEIFAILGIVEIAFSPAKTTGLNDMFEVVSTFGLLVYFARALPFKDAFLWMGLVCGVMGALGGFVYYSQLSSLPYLNPNAWAFFPVTVLFAIALGFPHSREQRGRWSWILLLLASVNMVWIFLSGSRSNMLAGVLPFLYMLFAQGNVTRGVFLLLIGVAAIFVVSFQFADQQAFALQRLQFSFDPSYSVSTRTSERYDIAMAGLQAFEQNPFGVGTGGFATTIGEMYLLGGSARPAHTAWVKVLVENGVPGFILLASFLLSFIITGWRKRKEGVMMLAWLVGITVAVIFIGKEYAGKGAWFLLAGGIVMIHKEEVLASLNQSLRATSRRAVRIRNGRMVIDREVPIESGVDSGNTGPGRS